MTNRELSLVGQGCESETETQHSGSFPAAALTEDPGWCFEGSLSVCVDGETLKVMQHQPLTEL